MNLLYVCFLVAIYPSAVRLYVDELANRAYYIQMTQPLFDMQKRKKSPAQWRGERLKCRKTFFDACVTRVVLY